MRTLFTDVISAAASIGVTAICVAMAAPAAAATIAPGTDADAPRTAVVRIADLDLATPAGRVAADHRVRAAATRVCTLDDRGLRTDGDCMKAAIESARATPAAAVRIASR